MSLILGTILPLAMLAFAASPVIGQFRGPSHPRLLLLEAFQSGFLLAIVSVTPGASAWQAGLWWATLALILLGQAASWRRLWRSIDSEDPPLRRREKPPGLPSLVLSGVLWAAVIGASLLAG